MIEFFALLERAGLTRMRFHDLRPTAATVMYVLGVPARTLMELLGHSQLSMTSRYTHVPDELKREAAERMGALLFPDQEVI